MATRGTIVPEESLPPYQLRDNLRKAVNEALAAMESDEYHLGLDALPLEERNRATLAYGNMYRLKRKLVTAQLEEIRDGLKENEAELTSATADLKTKLGNLQDVATVIVSANAFLGVASKVIAFL